MNKIAIAVLIILVLLVGFWFASPAPVCIQSTGGYLPIPSNGKCPPCGPDYTYTAGKDYPCSKGTGIWPMNPANPGCRTRIPLIGGRCMGDRFA